MSAAQENSSVDTTTRPDGQAQSRALRSHKGSRPDELIASLRTKKRLGLLKAMRADLDEGRGLPFLALMMASGVALYFALPSEPHPLAFPLVFVLLAIMTVKAVEGIRFTILLALTMLVLGLACGSLRTSLVSAPILSHDIDRANVTGTIVSIEKTSERRIRAVIEVEAISRLSPAGTPRRIRVSSTHDGNLAPGARVEMRASLRPPPGPAMPGGFSFAFPLYFQKIGATGFTYGAMRVLDADDTQTTGFFARIERLRLAIGERIAIALSGDAGAVATALLVGLRDRISDEAVENLRNAGLAHLLAISGMHMGLIVLTAFALLRRLLSFNERATLTLPVRSIAALAAFVVAIAYLLVSGAGIATQRAFVMVTLLLIGISIGRRAISLRSVALAAMIVAAIFPESLMGPSFQMSFAAAIALVVSYEGVRQGRWFAMKRTQGWRHHLGQVVRYPLALALTSLIASLATAPIAAYHFDRFAPLALIGNLAAMPLVGFVIMPAGLASLFAMPFGLEAMPLMVMGWGIDQVLTVAARIAARPEAEVLVPALRPLAIVILTGSLLWVGFWKRWQRWIGLVPAALVLILTPAPKPDIIIARSGNTLAVRQDDGLLTMTGLSRGRFDADYWLNRDGDGRPRSARVLETAFACDDQGCALDLAPQATRDVPGPQDDATPRTISRLFPPVLERPRAIIVHARTMAALEEECLAVRENPDRQRIIVTPLEATQTCLIETQSSQWPRTGSSQSAPNTQSVRSILIDAGFLRQHGATAIRFAPDSTAIIDTSYHRRTRPWDNPNLAME